MITDTLSFLARGSVSKPRSRKLERPRTETLYGSLRRRPATRSSTASRLSFTPQFAAADRPGACDYDRLLCPMDGFAATLHSRLRRSRRRRPGARLQHHRAVQVRRHLRSPRATATARCAGASGQRAALRRRRLARPTTPTASACVRDIEAQRRRRRLRGQRLYCSSARVVRRRGRSARLIEARPGRAGRRQPQHSTKAQALVDRHAGTGRRGTAAPLPPATLGDCGARAFDVVDQCHRHQPARRGAIPVAASGAAPGCALAARHDVWPARCQGFLNWAAAHARDAQARDGLGMLVEQAAEAFFLWRGVRPDTAAGAGGPAQPDSLRRNPQ